MGKVRVLSIRMSRKISDDNYGSFGVEGEIELELAEKDDKDEMWAYGTSWLSAKLTGTHKAHGTMPSQPTAKPTPVPAGAVVKTGPAPVASEEEDVFNVDSIMVEFMPDGVTKSAKAKGGRWSKYGVKVWPEVLALPPLEWDLQQTDVAEYPVPKGLQAVVMMHEGKPRKVLEWK